jgi:Eco57I restriction-modification methylase
MADPPSTWGIPPTVRRILSARILELRGLLEEDARRQLAALGITEIGIGEPPAGRVLNAEDARAREVIAAVLRTAREAGDSSEEAVQAYVSEAAFTLLDRIVAFRCLEERGLLLVDGQPETLVRIDPALGASSLMWRVRAETPSANARDVARAAYRRACLAIGERVRVLFDPDDEHSVLFPLAATWDRVIAALNDPAVPATTYAEDEVLGWVYQYWNTAAKSAIYEKLGKGGKIEEPEELAAASTLYTERYIVDYLLQNTLGALWVEMHPESSLPASWPYYVRPPKGNPPVTREPKRVREITLLDPCVGSGHFLVRAFELFAQLYAEERIEDPAEVPSLILEHNLHGVDIDRRATQIAALALYLKGCAAAGPDFRPRKLNLVNCDLALPPTPPAELLAQFAEPELKDLVRSLWDGLAGVRTFGSLLHPERTVNEAFAKIGARDRDGLWARDEAEWTKRRRHFVTELRKTFNREAGERDLGRHLFGAEAGRGLDLLQVLGRRYDVVVTNPPYAGSGNFNKALKTFIDREYALGKRDLYSAFILRCREFAHEGAYVGMVTQQSWMFLRKFTSLRGEILATSTIRSIALLGAGAFEEIGGVVVSVSAFSLRKEVAGLGHWLSGIRVSAEPGPRAKEQMLGDVGRREARVRVVRQRDLERIPETPLVFWVSSKTLALLAADRRLAVLAEVRQGLATADNERFVRMFWEPAPTATGGEGARWAWYAKGGGYCKWAGLEMYVVDWSDDGRSIKEYVAQRYPYLNGNVEWVVKNETDYFRRGSTFSLMAAGALGLRRLEDSIFDVASIAVFTKEGVTDGVLRASLSTRPASYLLRLTTQDPKFHAGYLLNLPRPATYPYQLETVAAAATALKSMLIGETPTERRFVGRQLTTAVRQSGPHRWAASTAVLHALEGWNERLVFDAYELDEDDVQAVLDETGMPAGWFPLVTGYDALPDAPAGIDIPAELSDFLATLEHRTFSSGELTTLKARLRRLYEAGRGAKTDDDEPPAAGDDDEAVEVLGARIPIPTETFLEELSQKLELHPISVYWLLEELRERDGVVSPPLAKRELEDYVSVTLLRLLGYRWPEQDAYEAEHGPIFDPALVDADGIIPLLPCGDEPTAEARIRDRLERQFGDERAETFLRDFRKYVGRDLADWLRRDFFKRHAQQFKNRPIAWHLRSPEGAFEAFVLYHRLSRETLVKLRAEYAGPRIARLKAEAARAKDAGNARLAADLQVQVEDVEAFRRQLEAIERGDELRDRIRCRWKDETATGRPGPYAPDIDDGVKVNIRPFQETGLLRAKVITKW